MTTWEGQKFADQSFTAADLPQDLILRRCHFSKCDFRNARLAECRTEECTFSQCNFQQAKLNASVHIRSAFMTCRMVGASLFSAELNNCRLQGSDLADANLTG